MPERVRRDIDASRGRSCPDELLPATSRNHAPRSEAVDALDWPRLVRVTAIETYAEREVWKTANRCRRARSLSAHSTKAAAIEMGRAFAVSRGVEHVGVCAPSEYLKPGMCLRLRRC